MWHHFFPLLFPKDSESLKILDIRLREVGAKRPLNGTSKVNTQTNKQTDIWTFRLIESIGPEGPCFENHMGRGQTDKYTDIATTRWKYVLFSTRSGGSLYLGFVMLFECRYSYFPPLKNFNETWNQNQNLPHLPLGQYYFGYIGIWYL